MMNIIQRWNSVPRAYRGCIQSLSSNLSRRPCSSDLNQLDGNILTISTTTRSPFSVAHFNHQRRRYNALAKTRHSSIPERRSDDCVLLRSFQTVGQYHDIADDTLYAIQDAIEDMIEDHFSAATAAASTTTGNDEDETVPEVNYSDGVLTLSLPPHGTWVINKQTPNQQIWWSSPLSGPRRYEYSEEKKQWIYTRTSGGGGQSGGEAQSEEEDTLGSILTSEVKELYGFHIHLEV